MHARDTWEYPPEDLAKLSKLLASKVQAPQEQDVIPTNTIYIMTHHNFMHITSMMYCTM